MSAKKIKTATKCIRSTSYCISKMNQQDNEAKYLVYCTNKLLLLTHVCKTKFRILHSNQNRETRSNIAALKAEVITARSILPSELKAMTPFRHQQKRAERRKRAKPTSTYPIIPWMYPPPGTVANDGLVRDSRA